jgi:Protein of unknown function (DUF1232)
MFGQLAPYYDMIWAGCRRLPRPWRVVWCTRFGGVQARDFIPVLGYADDAIIVTGVVRDAVRAHLPGTDDGFAALARLTGIGASAP